MDKMEGNKKTETFLVSGGRVKPFRASFASQQSAYPSRGELNRRQLEAFLGYTSTWFRDILQTEKSGYDH
jgi:hypothetical protein